MAFTLSSLVISATGLPTSATPLVDELIQQVGHIAGDPLRLLLGRVCHSEGAQILLHGQHEGNVVIDAENTDGRAVVVPDVDGGGLQKSCRPWSGSGNTGGRSGSPDRPQNLQHHVGRTVPHLAAGDRAVLNGDDGAILVVGGQIVDHHLTVGPKLTRQALAASWNRNCSMEASMRSSPLPLYVMLVFMRKAVKRQMPAARTPYIAPDGPCAEIADGITIIDCNIFLSIIQQNSLELKNFLIY